MDKEKDLKITDKEFDENSNLLGALGTYRGLALVMAVIHHGLSNISPQSIPASVPKVLETARSFDKYIRKNEINSDKHNQERGNNHEKDHR